MSPRNTELKAFTLAPVELALSLISHFEELFPAEGKFECECRIYRSEILLRLGCKKENQVSQINFIASTEVPSSDQAESCIEALTHSLEEIFADYFHQKPERDRLPHQWSLFREGEPVYYFYDGTNTALEKEADRLLGLAEENSNLIVGDLEEEQKEIEEIIEILSKESQD